ncbi:MAG: M14 family zinc carboxypeptidase [Planctomycetota bacterium]
MRSSSPRLLLAALALLPLLGAPAAGQAGSIFDPGEWFDVWIHGVARDDVVRLSLAGLDIENVRGTDVMAYVNPERHAELAALGYRMSIPPRAGGGAARAGYHTFAELTAELQAAAAAYPSICALFDIGRSVQNRQLWFLKISDQVGVEEDEPEFKYISSMHGDEVVGMELCLKLIGLLTTQYGIDPQITRLVDEAEIWIMPLMNPDGYVAGSRYNAQGYDLNREFPDRVVDPNNTTTGRPAEVRHVMNWAFAHSSVLSANFHGGALVVNYPYDSDPNPWATYSATPDDALIIEQSLAYSELNGPMYNSPWFNQGITNGVAWYMIYGGMQDWNYVWQGCNEVTIELDDDKWPPYSQIAGLWDDNRASMLAYMELCLTGVRGTVTDFVTGAPVAAAVRAGSLNHYVYADPQVGDYHRMLRPGTYSLAFSASGYLPATVSGVGVGSGDATVVDVTLVPETFNPPDPDIRIDGQDGPLSVPRTQPITLTVSLQANDLVGRPHDWWVKGTNGTVTYWWYFPSLWLLAPTRCYDGGLMNLVDFPIAYSTVPPGTWTFTFAVDALDNAYQGTYADTITLTSY